MSDWNKRLQRLVWKNLGKDENQLPSKYNSLLNSISETFDTYEKDYALLNRVMDLSSEELFQANTELRKRNEELDKFIYITSHDIRAPITSILGLLELIYDCEDSEEQAIYLVKLKSCAL